MRARLYLLLLLCCLSQACGEVAQCDRGAPGCLAGPPTTGRCLYGLVLINGACAEPGASAPALSCQCQQGQVCTLDAYRCVDYCAPLDVEIGGVDPPPAISCSASEHGFDELCQNRCLIRCRRWQELCPSSASCSAEACRSRAELTLCQDECGKDENPARCLAQRCSDVSAQGCKELACPGQQRPLCDDVQCRNSCPGFNFDGVCDDGDLKSAAFGVCAYGTDCADCGARRGPAPKPAPQGSPCAFHGGCAGANLDDLIEARAWCVEIEPGISRCAPDCSTADKICPEGSACYTLAAVDQDGDGKPDPLGQGRGIASACFPISCR